MVASGMRPRVPLSYLVWETLPMPGKDNEEDL